MALGPTDGFTLEDFQSAVGALPQEGLEESAQALSQALEGVAEQREEYWRNRIQPFWHHVWPKSRNFVTPSIAESVTRLSIAAGAEFPVALMAVYDWLFPIEHPDYIVQRLHESGLCKKFPEDALRLLTVIIDDQPWLPRELGLCLRSIAEVQPALRQNHQFQRLEEYSRCHGIS